MDLNDFVLTLGGVIVAAFVILRIVRVVNGRAINTVFHMTAAEYVILCVYCSLCFAGGAYQIRQIVPKAVGAIGSLCFAIEATRSLIRAWKRRGVNSPAPNPD